MAATVQNALAEFSEGVEKCKKERLLRPHDVTASRLRRRWGFQSDVPGHVGGVLPGMVFDNPAQLLLLGVHGSMSRTCADKRQDNMFWSRKDELLAIHLALEVGTAPKPKGSKASKATTCTHGGRTHWDMIRPGVYTVDGKQGLYDEKLDPRLWHKGTAGMLDSAAKTKRHVRVVREVHLEGTRDCHKVYVYMGLFTVLPNKNFTPTPPPTKKKTPAKHDDNQSKVFELAGVPGQHLTVTQFTQLEGKLRREPPQVGKLHPDVWAPPPEPSGQRGSGAAASGPSKVLGPVAGNVAAGKQQQTGSSGAAARGQPPAAKKAKLATESGQAVVVEAGPEAAGKVKHVKAAAAAASVGTAAGAGAAGTSGAGAAAKSAAAPAAASAGPAAGQAEASAAGPSKPTPSTATGAAAGATTAPAAATATTTADTPMAPASTSVGAGQKRARAASEEREPPSHTGGGEEGKQGPKRPKAEDGETQPSAKKPKAADGETQPSAKKAKVADGTEPTTASKPKADSVDAGTDGKPSAGTSAKPTSAPRKRSTEPGSPDKRQKPVVLPSAAKQASYGPLQVPPSPPSAARPPSPLPPTPPASSVQVASWGAGGDQEMTDVGQVDGGEGEEDEEKKEIKAWQRALKTRPGVVIHDLSFNASTSRPLPLPVFSSHPHPTTHTSSGPAPLVPPATLPLEATGGVLLVGGLDRYVTDYTWVPAALRQAAPHLVREEARVRELEAKLRREMGWVADDRAAAGTGAGAGASAAAGRPVGGAGAQAGGAEAGGGVDGEAWWAKGRGRAFCATLYHADLAVEGGAQGDGAEQQGGQASGAWMEEEENQKALAIMCPFNEKGVMMVSPSPQAVVHQCNDGCNHVDPFCNLNQQVLKGPTLPLEIFHGPTHPSGRGGQAVAGAGWGVRCAMPIQQGRFVCCVLGELTTAEQLGMSAAQIAKQPGLITLSHVDAMYKLSHGYLGVSTLWQESKMSLVSLPPPSTTSQDAGAPGCVVVVDMRKAGNVARFMRHDADKPNLRLQLVYAGGCRSPALYYLALCANTHIAKGEELTYDHSIHSYKP